MTPRFISSAEADVDRVLSWYRERGHDLADHFLLALEQCLDAVQATPEAFPVVHRDVRRALLHRFPYCVFYIITDKRIVVLACLHGHRDPNVWQARHDA